MITGQEITKARICEAVADAIGAESCSIENMPYNFEDNSTPNKAWLIINMPDEERRLYRIMFCKLGLADDINETIGQLIGRARMIIPEPKIDIEAAKLSEGAMAEIDLLSGSVGPSMDQRIKRIDELLSELRKEISNLIK